jgi:hypothetical protein
VAMPLPPPVRSGRQRCRNLPIPDPHRRGFDGRRTAAQIIQANGLQSHLPGTASICYLFPPSRRSAPGRRRIGRYRRYKNPLSRHRTLRTALRSSHR